MLDSIGKHKHFILVWMRIRRLEAASYFLAVPDYQNIWDVWTETTTKTFVFIYTMGGRSRKFFLLCSLLIRSSSCSDNPLTSHAPSLEKRQTVSPTFHTTADKPTQTGIPSNCNKFYDVVANDTCDSVEKAFGITPAQFLAWNVSNQALEQYW
jgi:hypothetical protein